MKSICKNANSHQSNFCSGMSLLLKQKTENKTVMMEKKHCIYFSDIDAINMCISCRDDDRYFTKFFILCNSRENCFYVIGHHRRRNAWQLNRNGVQSDISTFMCFKWKCVNNLQKKIPIKHENIPINRKTLSMSAFGWLESVFFFSRDYRKSIRKMKIQKEFTFNLNQIWNKFTEEITLDIYSMRVRFRD